MIHRFDQLSSTNDEAMRLARAGAEAYTAVVADSQQAGRGRNGHAWVSPSGVGLYASVILRPRLSAGQLSAVTLLAGVAAAEAVAACSGLGAMIKWPNDVLIDGRKVAGLLCEADLAANVRPVVIAGLGVNVNTPSALLPPRGRFPATSLMAESGRAQDREALLMLWIERLRAGMASLETRGIDAVLEAWRPRDALAGQALRVTLPDGRCLRGTGDGVAADGSLLLRLADGGRRPVIAGDVDRDTESE